MSGTLSPGTRIPKANDEPSEPWDAEDFKVAFSLQASILNTIEHAWWRDKAVMFALGAALGLLLGACLTALAWSHLGG